ncbi:hypothetical protein Tco_0583817 [Tanacetum coccineum]
MAEDTTSFEDDRFAFISTKDIQHTSCLLDNKISILKVELQRMNLELDSFKEKIKLNKQFLIFAAILLKNLFGFKLIHIEYYLMFPCRSSWMVLHGEEYDKVFNHLDMLNAPLEDFTTAKSLLLLLV